MTGEDVTQEELGGSRIHTRIGVGDLEVDSDEECIEAIKSYLSYFPQNCEEPPPRLRGVDPAERMDESCSTSCPTRRASPTTCTT